MAIRRIEKEIKDLETNQEEGILSVGPDGFDLFHWTAVLEGKKGSPYEGGKFTLEISLSTSYPFNPPKIRFKTPIFHEGIKKDGSMGLDILRDQWTPSLTVIKTLREIRNLYLKEPNDYDFEHEYLNLEAFKMRKQSKKIYRKTVVDHVKTYASS